ncbi:MAG: ferritin family protein, partial [Desulfobacterales bacterium]
EGERMEWTTLYTGFADVAEQESFKDAARLFKEVAEVEQWHERRYNKLIEAVQADRVFKRPQKALWKCRNCGRVIEAAEAPDICPTCNHPRAYFEILAENY